MRSSGARPDAGLDGGADGPGPQPAAVDADRAAVGPAGAVHRLEDLRAAGPDQAGEPDDLAGPHLEGHVGELLRRATRPSTSSTTSARGVEGRRVGEDVLDLAAGHQPDQLGGRCVRGGQVGGDGAAVLEDGDPVADLADLLEPVRDVDDGDALGGQVADDPEEVLHLLLVEGGGGLVHDDQPGVVGERPRHADDLLAGGGAACRPRGPARISSWPSRASSAAGGPAGLVRAGEAGASTSRGRGRCSRRRSARRTRSSSW